MSEKDSRRDEREENDSTEGVTRDTSTEIGLGAKGPVLPTDLDGFHPDRDWLASSDKNTVVPNWTTEGEPLEAGLDRLDAGEALDLPPGTHLLTVFDDDLGQIEEIYGYAPSAAPQWVVVEADGRRVLVPVASGTLDDDGLRVPYPKQLIESSPELPEGDMSLAQEMAFYHHYNERRILPAEVFDDNDRRLQVLKNAA